MNKKFLASYSPSLNDYVLLCIGGKKEKIYMQQIIKAKHSDEIIEELSEEKYHEIYNEILMKHVMCK